MGTRAAPAQATPPTLAMVMSPVVRILKLRVLNERTKEGNIMLIVVSQLILTTVVLVGFSLESLGANRERTK